MRKWTAVLLVLAALVFWLASSGVQARQTSTGYRFLLTSEQIRGFVAAWNNGGGYIPGETLVKFRADAAPAEQARALAAVRRGTAGATARWIGDVLIVSTPDSDDAAAVAATLARQPEVEWAQPNYVRMRKARPNDPDYPRQWNLDLIGMPGAWDVNPGGSAEVTVAVVDTGVTTTTATYSFPLWTGERIEQVAIPFAINPDIGAARIKPGRDFLFWDGPVLDMDGHGTWVAGTILQETNNSLGTAGIAYRTSLLPLKACVGYWDLQLWMSAADEPGYLDPDVIGGCSDLALAQALRYAADAGAQVINFSLSAPEPAPILRDAISYAVSRGSFVAIAVGNEFDLGNPVEYPAAYAAAIDGAMSVGAVGRSSRRAFYSNTGSHVEIVAPGGDFGDGGFGGLITQVGLAFADFDPLATARPRFNRYQLISAEGTSASAPHVAGVAALLYSQGITSPAAIEAAIERFATDLGSPGRDAEHGFGLVNARAALRGMGLAK